MLGARVTKHTPPARLSPEWHVIDAQGQRLGHLAVSVAGILQGKNKAIYSRHWVNGDFVVVINANKIEFSGSKLSQRIYYRHSGYVGNLRKSTLEQEMQKNPSRVIERAIKGMLPRTKLASKMLSHLHVYDGPEHPHDAQLNSGLGKPRSKPRKSPSERRKASRARTQAERAASAAVEIEDNTDLQPVGEPVIEGNAAPAPSPETVAEEINQADTGSDEEVTDAEAVIEEANQVDDEAVASDAAPIDTEPSAELEEDVSNSEGVDAPEVDTDDIEENSDAPDDVKDKG